MVAQRKDREDDDRARRRRAAAQRLVRMAVEVPPDPEALSRQLSEAYAPQGLPPRW